MVQMDGEVDGWWAATKSCDVIWEVVDSSFGSESFNGIKRTKNIYSLIFMHDNTPCNAHWEVCSITLSCTATVNDLIILLTAICIDYLGKSEQFANSVELYSKLIVVNGLLLHIAVLCFEQ